MWNNKEYKLHQEELESAYFTGSQYVMYAAVKDDILILTIFNRRNLKQGAEYVVFIQKDEDISLQLADGEYKWRTGTLYNLLDFGYYSANYGCYQNEKTIKCNMVTHEDLIKDFLKANSKKDVISAIIEYQNKIRSKKLDMKHKKITDKIDKQMDLVPELPADFDKWVRAVPFAKSKYIYYKRMSKIKVNGFCTSCRSEMNAKNAKHNKSGICPVCHKRIVYKAEGKSKRLYESVNMAIMQKTNEGIVIRFFRGSMDFSYERYKNVKVWYHEYGRTFISGTSLGEKEVVKSYEWSDYCNRGTRWCEDRGTYTFPDTYLYTKNIDTLVKNTKWQYSQLNTLAKRTTFNLEDFLFEYIKNPRIEYLIKGKLYRLTRDIVNSRHSSVVDMSKKKISEALGVGKEVLPQLQRLNTSGAQLRLIQKAYEKGIKIIDKQVIWADEKLDYAPEILKATEYTTIHKAIRYIDSQPGAKDNVFRDWLDYLGMCKKLKYDLNNSFVLFPKHLKAAHDEANELIDFDLYGKKHQKKIVAMHDNLTAKYAFNDKKYLIKVPVNANEIVAESHKLRHCVKQYIKDVAAGKTVILFIRSTDAPDKPFYTLEVKNGSVTQCRGYRNADTTQEIEKFIERWKSKKLMLKGKKQSA